MNSRKARWAYQLKSAIRGGADGRISESLPHLFHDLVGNVDAEWVILGKINRRQAQLGTRLGDKDLVLTHMGSASVMLCVAYAPGMVGNAESNEKKRSLGEAPIELSNTYEECRIQPIALLMNFDSENA